MTLVISVMFLMFFEFIYILGSVIVTRFIKDNFTFCIDLVTLSSDCHKLLATPCPCNDYPCYGALEIVGAITIILLNDYPCYGALEIVGAITIILLLLLLSITSSTCVVYFLYRILLNGRYKICAFLTMARGF